MGTVFSIPPHEPFVDALARGLLDEAEGDALALADALVLLPTRRACRSLQDAFLRRNGGKALLLPQIQPLGDVDPDELIGPAASGRTAPPAIGRLRRQLLLSRLLAPVEEHLAHRLRLAAELALLLDELQTDGVGLEAVGALVPDELAEHWQRTRRVLDVLATAWPSILAGEGVVDPATRRDRLLRSFARTLLEQPSRQRVVAAGTTGSIPATRALLQAILALPNGAVVLPGLDLGLDGASWAALPPTHAQAGLKQLLDALHVRRADVLAWPAGVTPSGRVDRLPLLREAMRPAEAMAAAPDPAPIVAATRAGLTVHELPDQAAEALLLALRMRDLLETPGRTAALVTPDRALARRVAVELRRFGVEVDDSAGTPLDRTPAGTFLLLLARLLGGVAPVPLLALLKHPLARLGERSVRFRATVRELERTCLRGPHVAGGFSGILAELVRTGRDRPDNDRQLQRIERLHGFVTGLERALRPFLAQAGEREVGLGDLLAAHVEVAGALAAGPDPERPLWGGEDGEAAAELCREIHGAGDLRLQPGAYPALLAELMAARPVRMRRPGHPRLAILGQLEARLQQADLVLVGGMNEGVWPGPVDGGPWLNRAMREQLGLAPVERRIGLAAHDVQQLLAAPEVIVSRAERDAAGNPTVPSRWLVRLRALLGPAPARDPWTDCAAQLDQPPGPPLPVDQPRPRPPLAARPRALSVSDVGTWMRDPYALYAKRVLGLRPLEPLEADPGALERGILIHEVLEAFVRAHPDTLPEDPLRRLLDLGARRFEDFAHRPQVRALWRPRFERAARWYLEQEQARRPNLADLRAEVAGRLVIEAPGGPFALTARADRIERDDDGRTTIVDYKTGAPPRDDDVGGGRQPQLPLEAWIFLSGAFDGLAPGEIESLQFWSLRGDVQGGVARSPKGEPAYLAAAAAEGLRRLIAHYDDEATTYPARLRPDMSFARDYEHLARFKEWAG